MTPLGYVYGNAYHYNATDDVYGFAYGWFEPGVIVTSCTQAIGFYQSGSEAAQVGC